jgi:hypothetical protein
MAQDETDAVPLHDYVKQSIMDIVRGVAAAKAEAAGLDPTAFVNPVSSHRLHSDPVKVEFDVAVTASERLDKIGGAGIGVQLTVVKVEGRGGVERGSERSSTNRLRFTVPVALPCTPTRSSKPPEPSRTPPGPWAT